MAWRQLEYDDEGLPTIPGDSVLTSVYTYEERASVRVSAGDDAADTVVTYTRKHTVTQREYRGYSLAAAQSLLPLIEQQTTTAVNFTASINAIGGGGYNITATEDSVGIWSFIAG